MRTTLLSVQSILLFRMSKVYTLSLLPVYKVEAATNAGAAPEKAFKRCAEVHQAELHIVLEAIRELCAPSQ